MVGISQGQTGTGASLESAILLYSDRRGTAFATAHPIVYGKDGERPVLGAGRPVDRQALLNAIAALEERTAPKAEFLPATVIGVSPMAVTWWCPPAPRRVFFKCEEIGQRSAVVPHPGLVFQASNMGFRVFALEGSERPSADTALFEPPYFNTWDWGKICIGTAHVPSRVDVASIAGWEAGFFDSAFTHPNHGGKRVAYQDGHYAFWRDMLDGKFEAFPIDVLVPMEGVTVGKMVAGQIRGDA
jgi:PRTRC genetic system protein B